MHSRSGTSYNFCVRGVDRLDSKIVENTLKIATAGIKPFIDADFLWKSVQYNISEFINANDGISTINEPIKNRPDWDKIREVLEGKKPISDLGFN